MNDTTRFQGVEDLHALFKNLSVQRLSWAFLHREAEAVAFALGITLPPEIRNEKLKMAHIKAECMKMDEAPEPRVCRCEAAPTGFRWMRFDDNIDLTVDPVRVHIDKSVPDYFRESVRKVVESSHFEAYRFRAVIVDDIDDAEVIIEHGSVDERGGTLGVTIYYDDGTDDIDVGLPIRVVMDTSDYPVGVSLDIYEYVFDHEFKHVRGHDHTPVDDGIDWGNNNLDAFFTGVLHRRGRWDLKVDHDAYGQPLNTPQLA